MASGSFTGSTNNQYITPRILWSSTPNTAANTSNITVTLQLMKSSSSSSSTYGTGSWTVLINGVTYDFSATVTIPANNTYITVYTKTVNNIPHNDDGTKSVLLGWSGGMPGTSYTTTSIPNTAVSLDTIVRASTISSFGFTNGYIDQGIDVTIASKVSTNYHDIHLYVEGSSNGLNLTTSDVGRKQGGTHHINFTTAQLELIYSILSSKTSSKFIIYVKTYSNATTTTSIGDWQNATATGNINANVKPTISAFTATINSGGLSGLYVQGKSAVKLTCTATMGSGASVSSYKFSGPNLNASTTNNYAISNTIASSGTLTYTVTVTDSRGRTASSQVAIYVYPYSNPSFKSTTVNRSDSSGALSSSGTYAKYTVEGVYSSVGGKNTRTITIAHSSNNGSTYSAETTIQATTNLTAVISGVYGGGALSAANSYKIRFTIKDSYGATATSVITLSTASRAINIKSDGNGIAFGKIAEGNGIETPWDITFKGSGQKSLVFESGSSSAWKTFLYQGAPTSVTVFGMWDSTNSRSVFSYSNGGNFYLDRPVVFNGGIAYISVSASADLNNYKTPGFYRCQANATAATLKNCPTTYAFSLLVEEHAGVKQTLTVYLTSDKPIIYVRNFYDSTWGAWSRLCYAGEHTVLWSGVASVNTTLTLKENFRDFKYLTCIIGTATEPYGIVLGSFLDPEVAELHFSASFTATGGVAGNNTYGAKFTTSSGTSIKLVGCGTTAASNLSIRKIVGWR